MARCSGAVSIQFSGQKIGTVYPCLPCFDQSFLELPDRHVCHVFGNFVMDHFAEAVCKFGAQQSQKGRWSNDNNLTCSPAGSCSWAEWQDALERDPRTQKQSDCFCCRRGPGSLKTSNPLRLRLSCVRPSFQISAALALIQLNTASFDSIYPERVMSSFGATL